MIVMHDARARRRHRAIRRPRDGRVADARASTRRARRDPLSRRHHRQLRRLQGAEQAVARPIDAGELRCMIGPNGAGKTTMMDVITGKTRPDAGTAFFGQTIDLHAPDRSRDRARRHRPQVPEADGVRAPHRVREPRARDEGRQARAAARCLRDSTRRQRDRIAAYARADPAWRRMPTVSPGCCRTARSSGSRSACC